jgi:hypothetical protein
MKQRWNDTDRENRRTRRKTCPSAILFTTNLTWTGVGGNSPCCCFHFNTRLCSYDPKIFFSTILILEDPILLALCCAQLSILHFNPVVDIKKRDWTVVFVHSEFHDNLSIAMMSNWTATRTQRTHLTVLTKTTET